MKYLSKASPPVLCIVIGVLGGLLLTGCSTFTDFVGDRVGDVASMPVDIVVGAAGRVVENTGNTASKAVDKTVGAGMQVAMSPANATVKAAGTEAGRLGGNAARVPGQVIGGTLHGVSDSVSGTVTSLFNVAGSPIYGGIDGVRTVVTNTETKITAAAADIILTPVGSSVQAALTSSGKVLKDGIVGTANLFGAPVTTFAADGEKFVLGMDPVTGAITGANINRARH